jgi:hypothetical protein
MFLFSTNEIDIYINKENKFVLSRHEKQFLDIMPNERHRIDLLR